MFYAALKRRSSTVMQTFVAMQTLVVMQTFVRFSAACEVGLFPSRCEPLLRRFPRLIHRIQQVL